MKNVELNFKITPDELKEIIVKHLVEQGYPVKPTDIDFKIEQIPIFLGSTYKNVFSGCVVNFSGEVVENALKNIGGK